jgi:hypothetical protein
MDVQFSKLMLSDIVHTLQSAMAKDGIVNIPLLAEEIRQRHEIENIALEDITAKLMAKAQLFNAAMEFDSRISIPSAAE